MSKSIEKYKTKTGLARASDIQEAAFQYSESARALNTVRAYQSDIAKFEAWCQENDCMSLPAESTSIAFYITALAQSEVKTSTISRALTAIREHHKKAGFPDPTLNPALRETWKGIRRSKGTAQKGKDPLLLEDIKAIVSQCDLDTIIGMRDRALLLLGFSGAFRRSELVSLDIGDLRFTSKGVEITLRRSKTDQEGKGIHKAIPYSNDSAYCPAQSLILWIKEAALTSGPLFRSLTKGHKVTNKRLSDKAIVRAIKKYVIMAGYDPIPFAGHSLRAGFATQAALNGSSDRSIMTQTGHRSRAMVDRYIRKASIWQDNAALDLGL